MSPESVKTTGDLYEARSDALEAAAKTMSAVSDLPIEVLKLLGEAADLTEELPPETRQRKPSGWQPILVGRIAIRNDQIKLMETFLVFLKGATNIVAGIAALSTLAGIPAGSRALADGVHGLYKLYSDLIARGFSLSPAQFVIITTLRALGTATAVDIRERLGNQLDGVDIESVLLAFSRAREPQRGIVIQNAAGQWQIEGV